MSMDRLGEAVIELAIKKALANGDAKASPTPVELAKLLPASLVVFDQRHIFERGQLIQFKPGMCNRRIPYGHPVIIVEVLPQPILTHLDKPGANIFREPVDLIIGELDDDGDFQLYHVDSRRFEPYTGEI